ncbi:similar to Saccharomyces cerevisiae YCR076C Putative protein of unknown function [Maudiozyma barnettii]|uniref:PI31 proteasome regulator C-terminal domain-containing protein n=1 Tax=Maudiozyma barnettii TaxID=61262 RepID=A0A8H2VFX9_9SACH|nr:Fub1p [Kazachstania barnettii]CAB4254775.1 similar to Saccharomyces cerevisiae YCR076C Putative protein of unknown function [Kazachstania barnettii]CAD1782913.1 similar to Saccharomyces cerevisiae YCR076C Putative protein of unknown function [Kazachstania barnettii]
MKKVSNKVQLVLCYVLKTLVVDDFSVFVTKENSMSNMVTATITREGEKYMVIVTEIAPAQRYMVNIFLEGHSNGTESFLVDYGSDLQIGDEIKFPFDFQEYCKQYDTSKACATIYQRLDNNKFMVEPPKEENPSEIQNELEVQPPVLNPIRVKNKPNDMPKFDDEYEVGGIGRQGPIDRYPGLNLPEKNPARYGNPDLYPMGQKDPFNFNDINARGGMTFDPFGTNNQSNMQDDKNEQAQRGPGWIPGSRYDDPFGKRNDDMNPSSGPGFGSGSGSGSGPGFGGGMFM